MQFDLYVCGKNDGEIILSLPESTWLRIKNSPFKNSEVVGELLGRLINFGGISSSRVLKPEELVEYAQRLQEQAVAINPRGVFPNSKYNSRLQEDLYLDQAYKILNRTVKRCIANGRDLVMVADSHVFKPSHLVRPPMNRTVRLGNYTVSIDCGTLESADIENDRYSGTVTFSDYAEGSGDSKPWIAKPIPKEVRMKSRGTRFQSEPIYVRERDINLLTEGYHFTLLDGLNGAMRDYAFEMIFAFKESSGVSTASSS